MRHRRLALGPHQFDNITEFRRIALVGRYECLVAFKAHLSALLFAAVLFFQCGAIGNRIRAVQVLFVIVHCKDFIEAQPAEQFGIPSGRMDDVQRSAGVIEPPGDAGKHSHEGAVHARTQSEVNDYPLTPCVFDLILYKGFQLPAILVAALAFNAHPHVAINLACEYA